MHCQAASVFRAGQQQQAIMGEKSVYIIFVAAKITPFWNFYFRSIDFRYFFQMEIVEPYYSSNKYFTRLLLRQLIRQNAGSAKAAGAVAG